MRTFLGLEIDTALSDRIHSWRIRSLPPIGRPVDPSNFHITLAFLGEQNEDSLERLCRYCDRISPSPIELVLDSYGYFPRPRVYWLGPAHQVEQLRYLHREIRKACRRAGIRLDKRPYQPHVTLFRKCDGRPPQPTEEPDFLLSCLGFALFESVSTPGGVRYHVLQKW